MKTNVWRALSHDTVIGPLFFAETSVTANIYLDMLQSYTIPQMPPDIFQQAGEEMSEHFAGTGLPTVYSQGTINAPHYCDIFIILMSATRPKRPGISSRGVLFFNDNAITGHQFQKG
ncbi:hypothetical protein AVEN_74941-1 [Araneus ventricosus]|uniref:Uncharacterized protein n=1 Tax=Araneus ventricosus TaxID=182803 RepID=A0A4Y2IZW3_ARAVE|nr:hypothetical protein AVEN_74941-1 [Araneus ventricosus]